ncbi:MAG: hypothetical protein IT328_05465 [Caldilineaceae bacterium]|nr:hypothetical protein [Caldilineaceae bacterium]
MWRNRKIWLAAASLVYLILTCYQLGLPGLHYDEAKEAGVNAVELLNGDPTTPFRSAALHLFGRQFPLMVQDYIGALNVYLALPLLWLTGVGVPNLRMVSVLAGLAVLPLAAYTVSVWQRACHTEHNASSLIPPPSSLRLTWGGVMVAWLLAASPSFVFWSRQGIFVTNLMQPLCFLALWQGTRWLATGERRKLLWTMLAAGLALYAKLLALWVISPWLLILALQWLLARRKGSAPRLDGLTLAGAAMAFILPLLPLILFNLQTSGTLQTLLGNAGQSYYGVDNLALWRNGGVRLAQLAQSLRGDQFWYLGGLFGNPAAVGLALTGVIAGMGAAWRRMVMPLALLLMAIGASCFTISDLFITHYALIQPLALAVAALGLGLAWQRWAGTRRWLALAIALLVSGWVVLDLRATLLYHQALARSGGLADHSDASYHLAYHLRYNGLGAPVALDWGMDAPVRYLSDNTVRPREIFGYESPVAPDGDFTLRLGSFLGNPDNVYLLHAPEQTVFAGRREAFLAAVAEQGRTAALEETFTQRDGTPLFELWRVAAQ